MLPLPPPPPALHYVCPHTDSPIAIDGDIHKKTWESVPWTSDFVDIEGDLRPKPTYRTRVKMLWDSQCLYIAAELEEPHVWGTQTQRDSVIFQDNDFEVFLNPTCDTRNYYELEINALNTVWDLTLPKPYREGGKADNSWDIDGLKSAVKVHGTINDPGDTDKGWDVELAIPWKAFNRHTDHPAAPAPGTVWRTNFSRVEWDVRVVDGKYEKIPDRPEYNWVWSPMGLIDMHLPDRWGEVTFSR